MIDIHPALGTQFSTVSNKPLESPVERFNAEMDYRYSTDPDRAVDERFEKRRDR